MTLTLREFIEQADETIVKMFKHQGRIVPMLHFIDGQNHEGVMPFPNGGTKDQAAGVVRSIFADLGVKRCLFIDEAWIPGGPLDEAGLAFVREHGVRNLPDRKEIILFSAEDEVEPMLMAQREIIRPEKGKAKLGPFEIHQFDGAEGRFVGFLPRKTRAH